MKPDGEDRMPNTSDPTDELRAFLRDQAPEDDHPTGERLVAYHERRLPSEEQEAMRRHLAACPDCAAQLLELAALVGSDVPPGPALPPAEMEAAWARFAAGTKTAEPAAAPLPFRAPAGAGRPPRSSNRWAWGLAALLAVTTAGLSALALHQGRLLRDLEAPRVGTPYVQLSSSGARGNRESEPQTLPFRPGNDRASIFVTLPRAARSHSAFEIRFETAEGTPRFSLTATDDDLAANSNILSLDVSRRSLPEGLYRIEVWGLTPGKRQKIVDHRLRVETP